MENNKFIVSVQGEGVDGVEKLESTSRYSFLFTPSSKKERACWNYFRLVFKIVFLSKIGQAGKFIFSAVSIKKLVFCNFYAYNSLLLVLTENFAWIRKRSREAITMIAIK
jgi:hypothetical protein